MNPSKLSVVGLIGCALIAISWWAVVWAAVPQGSEARARQYYLKLPDEIGFSTRALILDSTLDDLLAYVGYAGLTPRDLEQLPSVTLMDGVGLGRPCDPGSVPCTTSVSNAAVFQEAFRNRPLRPDEILATRFFAPKITNVNDAPETRQLGWRKLTRLRARHGSAAAQNKIDSAIILFNFFVGPGEKPFGVESESLNTQVMLTSTALDDRSSIYWLDYGRLSEGGKLSLKLDASFDARDLQATAVAGTGLKPYYVPDGCVACHGQNPSKSLVNYLDTDHWFDRLDNDFARVRAEGTPVLFDAGTDDPGAASFALAFDVIRRFNEEAERHASVAQPNSFHLAAGRTWLVLHDNSAAHLSPAARAVASSPKWSTTAPDKEAIEALNRYCFRCHGTIKFNVFDKKEVLSRRALIRSRFFPTPAQLRLDPDYGMPSDRTLDAAERQRILDLIR
jgi:hypothetical protein